MSEKKNKTDQHTQIINAVPDGKSMIEKQQPIFDSKHGIQQKPKHTKGHALNNGF